MGLADLSSILWREREMLELLLFKLEEEQLVLAGNRTRWLAHATREVEMVLDQIRRTEVHPSRGGRRRRRRAGLVRSTRVSADLAVAGPGALERPAAPTPGGFPQPDRGDPGAGHGQPGPVDHRVSGRCGRACWPWPARWRPMGGGEQTVASAARVRLVDEAI